MYKLHALTAAAALAIAGAATADDTLGGLGADVGANANATVNLSTVDTDADGKISKSEAQSNTELSKQFEKLDADRDGSLSQAEFAKFEGSARGDTRMGKGQSRKATPQNDSGATGTAPISDDTAPSTTKPARGN